jgi:peroxiredoxin Q/BCP
MGPFGALVWGPSRFADDMSNSDNDLMNDMTTPPAKRLPWGGIAFVGLLLMVAIAYMAWGALRQRDKPGLNVAEQARRYLATKNVKPLSEPLAQLLALPEEARVKSQSHPLLQQAAPDFDLLDHGQEHWQLKPLLAKGPVVVIFYYGYHCNHCVGQLFAVHDDIERFKELGATVVAISADPPAMTQQRFKQYGPFAFPVLTDPGNKVAQAYGVFTPARDGKREDLQHGTFVVGRDGRVIWCNVADEPFTKNRVLLYELARGEGRLAP